MTLHSSPTQIVLPDRLATLLAHDRALEGATKLTLVDFEEWFADNKLVFFPEYTDHGPRHIRDVLASAASLIADDAWPVLTPSDIAVLVISALLHDSAMHLSEEGFANLLTQPHVPALPSDRPWLELWEEYVAEASRFDGRKLIALFGDAAKPQRPPLDSLAMTKRDRLLVGDFLRRHHPRLAHEIAMNGVPGPSSEQRLCIHALTPHMRFLCGLVARSHGIDIRTAVEFLPDDERQETNATHVPYLMAVLRIADYLQIHRERAPGQTLQVRALRSPVSLGEWRAHQSIATIHASHRDPEALYIKALPHTVTDFVKLSKLLQSIQMELDQTWAVLGEVYGRYRALSALGLSIRRIRSNIDNSTAFAERATYVPRLARFDTAGSDLLKLLIAPLYGFNPQFGVRELVQNGLDAIREHRDLTFAQAAHDAVETPGQVRVQLIYSQDDAWLEVSDDGVGMDEDVVINYFLRAGASFRHSDAWRQSHSDDEGHSRVLRSGRFGVGALAAFLLGDRIEVSTKKTHASHGIGFQASIDDEIIELNKIDRPRGTTIRIQMPLNIAKQMRESRWDWYCLDDPPVNRYLDSKILEQRVRWPSEMAALPPQWRRVTSAKYSDIQWSCWLDETIPQPELVCNGLIVVDNHITYYSGAGFEGGAPRYLSGGQWTYGEGLSILTPNLSVFDHDGNLPLNLRRTGLSVPKYPFADELLTSIARDIVAFALVNLPEQIEAVSGPHHHPLLESTLLNGHELTMHWWKTLEGWSPVEAWSFAAARPSDFFLLQRLSDDAAGFEAAARHHGNVVIMNVPSAGVQAANAWLRYCLGGWSSGFGPLSYMHRAGALVVVASTWLNRVMRTNEIAKDLRDNIRVVQEHNGWVMFATGVVPREPHPEMQLVMKGNVQHSYDGFAEIFVGEVNETGALTHLGREWIRLLGQPFIPLSRSDRTRLMEHPDLREYVAAYIELERVHGPSVC